MTEIGFMTQAPAAIMSRLVERSGCSFLTVDAEHTQITPADCADWVERLGGGPVAALVRVPSSDDRDVLTFANTGVGEIIVPRIRTADEIERACSALSESTAMYVTATKGREVANSTPRAAIARVSAILETVDAFQNLDEICEVEAVQGFWIGRHDLERDMLAKGISDDPSALIARGLDTLRANGRTYGMAASTAAGIREARALGAARCSLYLEPTILGHMRAIVSI